MRCRLKVGFFVVRECGREEALPCDRCKTLVCDAHRRVIGSSERGAPPPVVCWQCDRTHDSDYPSRSSDSYSQSSTPGSERYSGQSYSGQGGSMGGGGATGGWSNDQSSAAARGALPLGVPAAAAAASSGGDLFSDPVQAAGFASTDEALFDQVAQFDEDRGSKDAYDS